MSQHDLIFNLAQCGMSTEAISPLIGLNRQVVQQIIADDPMHRARVVQSIKERSVKYRCTQSCRLMRCPVRAHDESLYEQSILEAHPLLSSKPFLPATKIKAKIVCFCKESLEALEGYLRQRDPQEDILELTAECLSALSPEPGMESVLKVLGSVEIETARKLLEKMRDLVPEEILIDLMNQLAKELHSQALCLAALIILEPPSERAFEEAFSCFTELLRIVVHTEAIDLAEEVSEKLSSSQLYQMNAVLGACSREGGDRLNGLRLKEAYALMKDEQIDKALCLVNTLQISPRLEEELMRFYDEAGLSSRNVPILEQKFYAKLEEIIFW